jgi:MFS-type transporter involved in bile tolerance (Atg22 family)
MNEKYDINYRSIILRILRNVLVYTLIIHIAAATFCYFIGWRDTYLYGRSLILGGVIVLALGLMSAFGGRQSMQLGVSNPVLIAQYRVTDKKQKDSDKISSYRFLILSSLVGILTVLSGVYIQTL